MKFKLKNEFGYIECNEQTPNRAEIVDMWISPIHRKRGIGTNMLQELVNTYPQYEDYVLISAPSARPFWNRFVTQKTKRNKSFYTIPRSAFIKV